jgi:hypothetical protein
MSWTRSVTWPSGSARPLQVDPAPFVLFQQYRDTNPNGPGTRLSAPVRVGQV